MNEEIEINLLILHHFLTNINNRRNDMEFIDTKLKNGLPSNEAGNYLNIHFELRKSQVIDICNFKDEYNVFKGNGSNSENRITEICSNLKIPFKKIDWEKFKKIRNTYIAHNLRDKKTGFIFLYKRQILNPFEENSAVDIILKAGEIISNHFETDIITACRKYNLEYYKNDFNIL